MERDAKVSVFESENTAEIQLMKSKLDNANIENFTENKYLTFTTTPTATTLKLMVYLEDEQQAFQIIDEFLQSQQND